MIIVEYCEFVMLFRFQTEFFISSSTFSSAGILVIHCLDSLRSLLSRELHNLAGGLMHVTLILKELLVVGVLLLANGLNTIEVVHVFDRAWAASRGLLGTL